MYKIGASAFYSTDIVDVTIPKGVDEIGNFAFGYDFVRDEEGYEQRVLVEDYIIRGYKGSVAEEYATNNNITFIALDEDEVADSKLEVNLFMSDLGEFDEEVVIKLIGDAGENETIVTGSDTSCQFINISTGIYTLEISKKNYVTRTYTVNVGDTAVQQDVELQLVGDITNDGTINARDKKLIYNHMAGTASLWE